MRQRTRFAPILVALLSLALLALPAAAWAQAHAHVDHVGKSWGDTPGKVGLLTILEEEAKVAAQHAGFAASKTGDLGWMQMHVHHVRHAIDPSSEKGGPGKGYGVLKAAQGVVAHVGFAAGSPDASPNVKLHATHIATSAQDVLDWSKEVMALSDKVLAATTAQEAAGPTLEIQKLATAMLEGTGGKSWQKGEGGVAQAMQHLGLLRKGEGM
jgi:hypothetical protein